MIGDDTTLKVSTLWICIKLKLNCTHFQLLWVQFWF